jgi:asparagine synthetase B (glutamine-hydrolysing)
MCGVAAILNLNGEIYNHADLRAERLARGHRFRSRADTRCCPTAMKRGGSMGCWSGGAACSPS